MMRYRTIVADPPWPYKTPGAGPLGNADPRYRGRATNGSGSVVRYGAMSMPDLLGLRPPAADNSHLYLWTTNGFMAEAHDVARAWGFNPKTILTWTKVKADGSPSMKTGYYFRGATEHCLFCVRGSLGLHATEALPTAYLWPRLPHSVKPDEFFSLVEKASPGPYLELFARRAREGWDCWGDEAPNAIAWEAAAA